MSVQPVPQHPPLPPRSHVVSHGVMLAEERARQVLAEQEAANPRIMDEGRAPLVLIPSVEKCAHPETRFSTRRLVDSPFDDHATAYGYCYDCREWLKLTTWKTTGETEASPLSERERDVLQAIEDASRRSDAS